MITPACDRSRTGEGCRRRVECATGGEERRKSWVGTMRSCSKATAKTKVSLLVSGR
jgi:hypothetical protein